YARLDGDGVFRETLSPLPLDGHRRTERRIGDVLLRREGLLPGGLAGVGDRARRLSHDESAARPGWCRAASRLHLGGGAKSTAPGQRRADALSPAGPDEETASGSPNARDVQEAGRLS